jgi:hypothetical protein
MCVQHQGFASTISMAVMLVLLIEGLMKCAIEMDCVGSGELDPLQQYNAWPAEHCSSEV